MNISQYYTIRNSKINHHNLANELGIVHGFVGYVAWKCPINEKYEHTTYFLIFGLLIFSLKGLSGLDILDEFESITINPSSGFTM